ncbi:ABC-2 type transport system permease protein [Kaistia soli DSM 19436]|uniref:ABC-2 type transport system permease protein n=1 Tax=Kaistia soli DSM 19436 TaxID=1122133 RepID=A0A1M4XUH7_9HYPH|nr:ABC transporter permease [Kaistia soli]SHE97098.1 ABC-2 type transport system permease protein [Kaistia soli DSM 19436]
MNATSAFSFSRVLAMMIKEFIQLKRDRMTFAMILAIPVMQLVLFGYAINTDPKRLPTLVTSTENGPEVRAVITALATSRYFALQPGFVSEAEASRALVDGSAAYVISIPPGFGRDLARGLRPQLLIEADATDPSASANALAALPEILASALSTVLTGPLAAEAASASPVDLVIHRRFNPEGVTAYNIVPGLLGTILTMTTILMTALALTRERERGTLENLMATPATPLEIMIGKIVPYIGIGTVQVAIIIVCARVLFAVPMQGSLMLLIGITFLFIAANVTLGYTFSTIAKTQMQAMQMTFFWFLPSILLSGFMFPFRGMPDWAQTLGVVLPLTHYIRSVRGIMLKGSGPADLVGEIWPLAAFWLAVGTIALLRYRRTLD